MEEEIGEEQVMSEVHLGCPPNFCGPFVSQFTFFIPSPTDSSTKGSGSSLQKGKSLVEAYSLDADSRITVNQENRSLGHCNEDSPSHTLMSDEDGDLVLTRRKSCSLSAERSMKNVLTIQHNITSSLPKVGLQVWKAALLLADFILHTSHTASNFHGITALELGAGTGLVGMVLARVAKTIFLTDVGREILANCAANVHLNSDTLNFNETSVCIRELNWEEGWPPNAITCDSECMQSSRYSWTQLDIEEAERTSVLLAADVIYSEELTDSLFRLLKSLMSRGSQKVLFLALEKRYNFSLKDLDVVANGYAHFRSFLRDEECSSVDGKMVPYFLGKQITIDQIPQHIMEYERGKDLELWKITYSL